MADIFTQQVRFYGKHGQYLEALTPDTSMAKRDDLPDIQRNKYLFATVVDIYAVAPLVGYLYQRSVPRDGNEPTKNIMEGALASHKEKLIFSYELISILDKKSEPDLNERIRRAFRATDETAKLGLDVFNGYARGGIEILYEKLVEGASTPEDMLRNLMDFIEEWNEKFLDDAATVDLVELLERK